MDEGLRKDIAGRLGTLHRLKDLLPPEGISPLVKARVEEEMNDLISKGYEPFFSGNAALYILSACQRCGRCCKDINAIAASIEDCRRVAKRLGMSQKRFMMEYTRPHILDGCQVGTARIIKKEDAKHCLFFDRNLPGCRIHSVKPRVCSAAYYLSKMNLLLCRQNHRFSTFPECPSDIELRSRIGGFSDRLKEEDASALDDLKRTFQSADTEIQLFQLLLRLKGMEIYFGKEKTASLIRKLGLKRMPVEDELKPAAFLYAAVLLEQGIAGTPLE